jgi:hypothetical protein
MDPRLEQLDEPHIRPLMNLIEEMRARGLRVPNANFGSVFSSTSIR